MAESPPPSTTPSEDTGRNADARELGHFDTLAADWWDPQGPMRALHQINPLRMQVISEQVELADADVCDVGCGAGLLAEALAQAGASASPSRSATRPDSPKSWQGRPVRASSAKSSESIVPR